MPNRAHVVITDYITEPEIERPVLEADAEITCLGARGSSELVGRLRDADVVLCCHDARITAEVLDGAARCRGVIRIGVGYDNIDTRAAGERGIVVCNVPDYGTEEVADHALALLLALARRLFPAVESVRGGLWNPEMTRHAPRLRGQTLGIIGSGRIGSALALRARVLGMRVVIFDPYLPRGFEKSLGVERVWDLAELLPQCRFLSVHCPLSDETRHMLDAARLNLLPRGAFLINTARGGIVDEQAVLRALDAGQLDSAALDVLECEPLADEELRRHPRLLVTPHCAFNSAAAGPELRRKAAEEALRLLRGEPPRNPVNSQFLRTSRLP